MRKKIFLILISLLFLIGCKKVKQLDIEEKEEKQLPSIRDIEKDKQEEEDVEEIVENLIKSPLSGLVIDEELLDKRPVGIMFDDHPRARWQAGLGQAEVVIEAPVEPPYTRYLAFYLANEPDRIGPIRSARPYFISKALELDSIYVHVGGSEEAKSDISKLKIANIDGMTSGKETFRREKHKKMPHNLYSSLDSIRKEAERKKIKKSGEYSWWEFKEEVEDFQGDKAENISINYANDNITEYIYDRHNKNYIRKKDGIIHIDENDDKEIRPTNIIIQYADIKVIDNEGRLRIDLVGEGEGHYISHGLVKDIIWTKENRQARTKYKDKETGQEIIFNPGQSFIQICYKNRKVEFDGEIRE